MHILTANSLEMATDKTNISKLSNNKSHIGFHCPYLHLTVAHSKGHGHAYFYCKYFENSSMLHFSVCKHIHYFSC